MKRIVIELEGRWVLAHRDDDVLPAAVLCSALQAENFSVETQSLTSLTLLTDDVREDEGMTARIKEIFSGAYPGETPDEILSLTVEQVADGPEQGKAAPAAAGAFSAASDGMGCGESAAQNSALQNVFGRVSGLVGAQEFKQLISEIVKVAPQIVGSKTYSVFNSRSYLFSVGDGCGLTTYLEILAQTVSATGLRPMHARPVTEERLGPYKEGLEPFEDVLRILRSGDAGKVRLLCVDISEWLGKTETQPFKLFLREAEKAADGFVIVFRVPFLDKAVLSGLGYSLNDLLSVTTVSFPPFSPAELKICAEREIGEYGFKLAKGAWEHFEERITEEKSDGKFYGLNTVKKVVRELVYQKQLSNAGKKRAPNTICRSDTAALCAEKGDSLSGEEQLERLIGNEQVKKKLREVIAQIETAKQDSRPCIHMRFVGNPGTGKTTVARILGKILKEKGLLRVGNFYEYAGRDFCGRYIGETAPKTASICRDAYGSVLFIDEAYSLYRGEDNDRDYGREAIDTLIAEMENHRDDFVVIMAGYTDDMEKLMRGNQGLASRMPYVIEFPNFTRDELYQIYASLVKARFGYDERLLGAAQRYFAELSEELLSSKEFGNARFVRNLFERTWAKAALRCQLENKKQVVLTKEDFDRASAEKEFAFQSPKRSRLGF